jgi:hypothetical protein
MVAAKLKWEFYRKWVAEEKEGEEFNDVFDYKFLEGCHNSKIKGSNPATGTDRDKQ